MGQYGAMQILSSIFLEYHAIPVCPVYSHNFLRVLDAAGKNNIFKKIKELGRIYDKRGLFPIILKGKETFTEKMRWKIDSAAGRALYTKTRVNIQWNLFRIVLNLKKSGKIRTGFCLITMKKVKLIDNRVDLHRE